MVIRHRQERDKRTCDRIKAVLAHDKGYTYAQIADLLLLDDETVRRHIKDYYGAKKLTTENGGSSGRLNVEESEQLITHLEEKTYLHVKGICIYVKKVFGKHYTVSGMRKWLYQHRFSYHKPHAVPAKANALAQEEFIQTYEDIHQESRGKEPIYFVDCAHPEYQTRLRYGWIRRGVRKELPTTARQYRVNIIGGICLQGHRIVSQLTEKIDAQSIMSFLKKLREHYGGTGWIHVIWDNAGYHHSRKVKEYAQSVQIKLHYLPPYSPNLNPIERLWKIMHESVTYNQYYEKFSLFVNAIEHFFKHIGRRKKILRSRINDHFHIIQSPLFAS